MKDLDLPQVRLDDLKIGMYVILPLAWHEHPFLKNHFVIQSEGEIRKLRELGLKSVQVDSAKSRMVETSVPHRPKPPPEKKVETAELITAVHDRSLPPESKSKIVRQHSVSMMKDLLENPTAENILEAQKGISEVVQLILDDNSTLFYLLNITSHDFYTYTHSVSVGILGVSLSKVLFKDSDAHDLQALGIGFFLHDIGKVNIDPTIITKPGKLTADEMNEMRRHPAQGFKLLHESKQLTDESRTIVLQHHERFDGNGYPKRLRNQEIHIYGRICSIADVYDALTSDRPYRQKLHPFDALKIMREEMIHHFQKDLFEKFVMMFRAPK
jgi:HD-GYP domain-containing protein (c-di-GMP phosphodiesterase class II)